jgi:hypothetical protein
MKDLHTLANTVIDLSSRKQERTNLQQADRKYAEEVQNCPNNLAQYRTERASSHQNVLTKN